MASWILAGRHVVYIHPDRLAAPIDHVPVAEIKSLPIRCLYLATSDADGQNPNGLFVWLEYDTTEARTEVRLQIDQNQPGSLWMTITDPIHVVRGSLRDAISATHTTTLMRIDSMYGTNNMPPVGKGTELDEFFDRMTHHKSFLLAAIAQLADPAIEILDAAVILGEPAQQWANPQPTDQVTLWLAS